LIKHFHTYKNDYSPVEFSIVFKLIDLKIL